VARARRHVASVMWRQVAANEIEVRYHDGQVERVDGTHADAARLASGAGLAVVASPLGTVRWAEAESEPSRPASPRRKAPAGDPVREEAPGEDPPPRQGRLEDGGGDGGPRPKRIGPWLSG